MRDFSISFLTSRQSGEFKASADAAILADFGGELLLGFNPRAIERRDKFRDAALAQRRRGVAREQFAQGLKLEQARAGVGHWYMGTILAAKGMYFDVTTRDTFPWRVMIRGWPAV